MTEALVIAASFTLAGFVHTVAGFGSALVSVPIIIQFVGKQTAAPMQAILSLPITIAVFYQNRRAFRWRDVQSIVIGMAIGVPIVTFALQSLPDGPVMGCLGVVLLVYAAFELIIVPRRAARLELSMSCWR